MTALAVWAVALTPAAVLIARTLLRARREHRAAAAAAADLAIIEALWSADVDDLTPAEWEAWFRS